MSGKKRFGISSSISQGMTDAVKMGESTDTGYRNTVIPLNRIELDEIILENLKFHRQMS